MGRHYGIAGAAPVLATALCTLLPVGAGAQNAGPTADNGPIKVSFSLDASKVVLGEPIILNYELVNQTQREVPLVVLRADRYFWLDFTLYDEARKVIDQGPDQLPSTNLTVGTGLKPGASYKNAVVVSQWLAPSKPGRHTLRVRAHLRYKNPGSDQYRDRTAEVRLPLMVAPPDVKALQEIAGKLCAQCLSADPAEADRAMDALFSMPPAAALPAWRRLAIDPSTRTMDGRRGKVIQRLVHLGTPAAVSVLAGIWEDRQAPGWGLSARSALVDLYRDHAALRPIIAPIFLGKEGRVPALPGPGDPIEIGTID